MLIVDFAVRNNDEVDVDRLLTFGSEMGDGPNFDCFRGELRRIIGKLDNFNPFGSFFH